MLQVRFFLTVIILIISVTVVSQASAKSLVAPSGICQNAEKAWKQTSTFQQQKAFLCLVDYARKKNKSTKVKPHKFLNKSAKIQRNKIIDCGVLSHAPCGHHFGKTFKQVGYLGKGNYSYREAAENIQSSNSEASPKDVFIAFMDSPPHRKNILKKNWKDVGISAKKGKNLGDDMYQVIWVNHFGIRK